MKKLCFLCFLAMLAYMPVFSNIDSIYFGGVQRYFRVHLPSGYHPSSAYPLVLTLHGNGSTSEEIEIYSQMNRVADSAKFVVVYPDGLNNTWNSGFNFPYNSGTDDVGFISALIDTISTRHKIKSERVYACGMSMGGFMSFRLACELNHKLAAIGSVTGLMSSFAVSNCQQAFRMPVVEFHGTDDSIVPYLGSLVFSGAEQNTKWWSDKNGCNPTPIVKALPDLVSEGSSITTIHYDKGTGQSEVLLYKVINGGHTWPGSFEVPSLGNTNQDINASVEIWNFFNKHELDLVSIIQIEPEIIPQVYPNPFVNRLHFENIADVEVIEVFDLSGKKVYSAKNTFHQNSLDLGFLKDGLFFVKLVTDEKQFNFKIIKNGN